MGERRGLMAKVGLGRVLAPGDWDWLELLGQNVEWGLF